MTLHITADEANAWADQKKLNLATLDSNLEGFVSAQVLGQLSQSYDTSSFVDSSTTPKIVRSIMAMMYVGYFFQRTYSEDEDLSNYGSFLLNRAMTMLQGVIAGTIALTDAPVGSFQSTDTPQFYPTDASTALDPNDYPDDLSVGPEKFSMNTIW